MPQALSVHYFRRVRNIGDQCSPLIASVVAGVDAFAATYLDEPCLLALGSMVSVAAANTVIWGTGLMGESFWVPPVPPERISAVRGKLTWARLRAGGVAVGDVALGDPGILIQRLLPPEALGVSQRIAGRLGLVPHYVDRHHPVVRAWAQIEGVQLLDVHWPVERFFKEMARCEWIVSSSLHGLVFADALGLPNVWAEFSGQLGGGRFKFHDYYSVANDPKREPAVLSEMGPTPDKRQLAALRSRAHVSSCAHLEAALVDAFPHALLRDLGALRERSAAYVPLAQCRQVNLFKIAAGDVAPTAVGAQRIKGVTHGRDGQSLQQSMDALARYFSEWAECPRIAVLYGVQTEDEHLQSVLNQCAGWLHCQPDFDVLVHPLGPVAPRPKATACPLEQALAQYGADAPVVVAWRKPVADVAKARCGVYTTSAAVP